MVEMVVDKYCHIPNDIVHYYNAKIFSTGRFGRSLSLVDNAARQ